MSPASSFKEKYNPNGEPVERRVPLKHDLFGLDWLALDAELFARDGSNGMYRHGFTSSLDVPCIEREDGV